MLEGEGFQLAVVLQLGGEAVSYKAVTGQLGMPVALQHLLAGNFILVVGIVGDFADEVEHVVVQIVCLGEALVHLLDHLVEVLASVDEVGINQLHRLDPYQFSVNHAYIALTAPHEPNGMQK